STVCHARTMTTKRICVITSGSIASTPRMLKAADALHEAGYQVRVVHAEFADWADAAATSVVASRTWRSALVQWRRHSAPLRYTWTRLRHKAFRIAARYAFRRLGLNSLARAASRVPSELIAAACQEGTDLVYAGTAGGLAVGALVARQL